MAGPQAYDTSIFYQYGEEVTKAGSKGVEPSLSILSLRRVRRAGCGRVAKPLTLGVSFKTGARYLDMAASGLFHTRFFGWPLLGPHTEEKAHDVEGSNQQLVQGHDQDKGDRGDDRVLRQNAYAPA